MIQGQIVTWGLILAGGVVVALLPAAILNREEIRGWAARLVRDLLRVAGVVGMSVGLAVMWFAIQTADEGRPIPRGRSRSSTGSRQGYG